MMQLVAQRSGKAGARLRVVLQILQEGVGNIDLLPGENRLLPGLVEVVFLGEDGKSALDRPVKEIRLGETKRQNALGVANAALYRERLAQAQEVIGAVVDADKSAFKAAHAAVQSNTVLALFLD